MNIDSVLVNGNSKLGGCIATSGYKHAVIPIIALAPILEGTMVLKNIPDIADVNILLEIFNRLDISCSFRNNTIVISSSLNNKNRNINLCPDLCSRVHGTLYLLPSLLARYGSIVLPCTGGCPIAGKAFHGKRPVQHVIKVLKLFGAKVALDTDGSILGICDKFHSCIIDIMDFSDKKDRLAGKYVSGSTKMAIMAAAAVKGNQPTIIKNPYLKPEILELLNFLKDAGVAVKWTSKYIEISSNGFINSADFTVMSDLLEVGTFLSIAALHRVNLKIYGHHLTQIFDTEGGRSDIGTEYLHEMGLEIKLANDHITVSNRHTPKPLSMIATSQGLSTDLQPLYALVLTKCLRGVSEIEDEVWAERFHYIEGLNLLGCYIKRKKSKCVIYPSAPSVPNQNLWAPDLRAAATFIIAATLIDGNTIIHNVSHLQRGYEGLIDKLIKIGASIEPLRFSESFNSSQSFLVQNKFDEVIKSHNELTF